MKSKHYIKYKEQQDNFNWVVMWEEEIVCKCPEESYAIAIIDVLNREMDFME